MQCELLMAGVERLKEDGLGLSQKKNNTLSIKQTLYKEIGMSFHNFPMPNSCYS